jgi:acetyl esterase/lipase
VPPRPGARLTTRRYCKHAQENSEKRSGGTPDRIVVAGNSAGATHVADFAAAHGGDLAGVRGVAQVSGIYTARPAAPGASSPGLAHP